MTDYTDTPAYQAGYADGKAKVHFELRHAIADHDVQRCGCEPCITSRQVIDRWLWSITVLPDDLDPETPADVLDRYISGAYSGAEAAAALVAL